MEAHFRHLKNKAVYMKASNILSLLLFFTVLKHVLKNDSVPVLMSNALKRQ